MRKISLIYDVLNLFCYSLEKRSFAGRDLICGAQLQFCTQIEEFWESQGKLVVGQSNSEWGV